MLLLQHSAVGSRLVSSMRNAQHVAWRGMYGASGVQYVCESTAIFTEGTKAELHIKGGAKRAVIFAPPKDAVPIYVVGVNHNGYNTANDTIVSNASCTTKYLAPLAKDVA